MGKILSLLIAGMFLLGTVSGQSTTYILLRHAEKDTSTAGSTAMTADPPLAPKGALRAQNLLKILEAYQPDAIYSTNYTRTRSTVTPLSKKFSKEIQLYDPKQLIAFAEQLLQIQGKTIVVVGHSNTTPVLVNLLIKETGKYPNLDDSDYSHLWIVTVTDGKGVARMVEY
jgi:broad specificity phosphatase PhoE